MLSLFFLDESQAELLYFIWTDAAEVLAVFHCRLCVHRIDKRLVPAIAKTWCCALDVGIGAYPTAMGFSWRNSMRTLVSGHVLTVLDTLEEQLQDISTLRIR